jgi:hypothetical protein
LIDRQVDFVRVCGKVKQLLEPVEIGNRIECFPFGKPNHPNSSIVSASKPEL